MSLSCLSCLALPTTTNALPMPYLMIVCLLLSSMDLTPDQVYQAIDNLSSAMSGLGRRTQQDSNAPRLLASSPDPIQGGELQGASFAQQREQRGESPEAMSNGEQKGASFAQPSAQSGASFDSQHGQKGASYAQQSGASFAPRK